MAPVQVPTSSVGRLIMWDLDKPSCALPAAQTCHFLVWLACVHTHGIPCSCGAAFSCLWQDLTQEVLFDVVPPGASLSILTTILWGTVFRFVVANNSNHVCFDFTIRPGLRCYYL